MAMRRIGTEEHFAIPEQLDAWRGMARSVWASQDLELVRGAMSYHGQRLIDDLLQLGDARIAAMDEHGIDVAVLSLCSPGVQLFDPETASDMAELANDRLAEQVRAHPGRLAGLAVFAPHHPERAVAEVRRAIRELGLHGLVVNSHTDGHYLDEPRFWDVLAAIEELGVPLYIHPRTLPDAVAAPFSVYHLSRAAWGYAVETATHAYRLIVSGVLDRFPRLRLVLGHLGEGIPFWLYRIDYWNGKHQGKTAPQLQLKASDYVKRNFAITVSGAYQRSALDLCLTELGDENIMFATDYPYQRMDEAVEFFDQQGDLPAASLERILHANAERIFGLTTGQPT
ncbi:amidohydrolase family protein [Jiangella asiatica]|uniref:Amidohydrolase n=1 Tax=Jiangella asiatica TaxID=2530372 RepID=A0A4R5CN47_9ACTN|nr:amidohydrolase family protein [Jiangella asiatica]TDE00690.1 amidohydrolase [Jiangella asiatica]